MNPTLAFLSGGGEMGALMRAHDWAETPMGPPERWPQSLRSAVSICLNSPMLGSVLWGPHLFMLYNDAYIPSMKDRHPSALGRPVSEVWDSAWEQVSPPFYEAMASGQGFSQNLVELPMIRRGQSEISWWNFTAAPIRGEDGSIVGLFNQGVEITEQVRSSDALRASESSLRELNATLESRVALIATERDQLWRVSQDPFLITDRQGRWLSASPAWTEILGWTSADLIGRTSEWMEHPDDRAKTRQETSFLAAGEMTLSFLNRFRGKDGQYRSFSWTAVPQGDRLFCVARDVTVERQLASELDQAQAALRQSQKMEAVGQLTGGLAHDFNNLLAGISGSLELIQARISQGRLTDIDRYMSVAQGASKRAAALTHRLLAFARRQTLDPKPTNVNRLVTGMEELIRRTVGPSIHIEVVGAGGLWAALIDPGQLENSLLNLCINARDAMPGGGRLTIETANRWLDEVAGRGHEVPSGQYLSVSVTDTGIGMEADLIEKVFEPFFTTKPIGEGTGLGLSMVYGFARQSGGQVRIYSEVGQGTTVCLYLPRHQGDADTEEVPRTVPESSRANQGKTVLVVDDEPSVRMLVTEVLEDLGYSAIEAADSMAGLKLLQSNTRIDLLITDVGLPGGMNGRQMADAARERRNDLKILFITGYAENAVLGNGLKPGMRVLTKPFQLQDLADRIEDLVKFN